MSGIDIDVGFRKKPENLETIMTGMGYTLENLNPNEERTYTSKNGDINLFYFPKAVEVEEGDIPNWEEAGYKGVIAEININYHNGHEIALKLAYNLARLYSGVICHPIQGDYFEPE